MTEKRIYPRPVPSSTMQSLHRYFELHKPLCEVCHKKKAEAYSEYYDLFWCRECGDKKTAWMLNVNPDEKVQEEFTKMLKEET